MTNELFDTIPDDARLWIFGAEAPLDQRSAGELLRRVDGFLQQWHAHGHPVVGARELMYDRFLLVVADERATGVSGCSIDSLFRVLKDVEKELEISLVDSSLVFYRDATGEVRSATRAQFRQRVSDGEADRETVVFDNTVRTLGELRRGGWERRLQDSWHARAFALEGATSSAQ